MFTHEIVDTAVAIRGGRIVGRGEAPYFPGVLNGSGDGLVKLHA